MPVRPERVALVVGTETEVGKTWVACAAIRALRSSGVPAVGRKPVQSFAQGSGATDAELLAAAAGEHPQAVCPAHRWLPLPMAPPMAAEALGLPSFSLVELVRELAWPAVRLGLVEGVGGVRSPLASDGDSLALVAALEPDVVVLVAPAALGAINAVRLAASCLPGDRLVVFLNRFDPSDEVHQANRRWLEDRDGLVVVTGVERLLQRLDA
jgi:dethiobiotin synthetase